MNDKKKLSYERVILVGTITKFQNEAISKEHLEELEFLTQTAGGEVFKRFVQKRESPHTKTYVGLGKMTEIQEYIKEHDINIIIFDDDLSPAQQKNISKVLKINVVDRTGLILDIFAQRARSSYAATQVELAQYEYLLPRLTGLWTHLERQKGGIGMRGPGETEIETDRRIVRNKISLLKKKLQTISKQVSVQRGNRGSLVRVALVGYTNVGKSTLMNVISKSTVFTEDKLFATLDTTVRKVVVRNLPFLMSDTVGFIRKLPTQLIAAFKSTLDESKEADLLLHVVDISHPQFEEHITSVHKTLSEIGAIDKPTIMVFNKIDQYKNTSSKEEEDFAIKNNFTINEWKDTWFGKHNQKSIFISAKNKENIKGFKQLVYDEVRQIHIKRFPYNHFLYQEYDDLQ